MVDTREHWETVYRTKRADEVSWFQRDPAVSLQLIRRAAAASDTRIIDVGGGASTLVGHLLESGYAGVTVMDLSHTALQTARTRVGMRASGARWIQADVLMAPLRDAQFDLWHDRAVFHFLVDPDQRATYRAEMRRVLKPDGHLVIATFAEDGPTRCSGLPVARYSAGDLVTELGGGSLVESVREQHVTPSGTRQSFVYCLCRRTRSG